MVIYAAKKTVKETVVNLVHKGFVLLKIFEVSEDPVFSRVFGLVSKTVNIQ